MAKRRQRTQGGREWDVDEALAGSVRFVLSQHVGRMRAISRGQLVAEVRRWHPQATERQVRAAVNWLRKQGVLICSTGGVGGGYWMARDRAEVEAFLEREVRPRYLDLQEIERAMKQAMLERFGQPTLFEATNSL